MKPSQALSEYREQILDILRRHGAEDPRVFGSVVRAEDRDGSDLDLLVRFPAGTSLLHVSALLLELEQVLGCPVDVLSEKGLKGSRGERIRREARRL